MPIEYSISQLGSFINYVCKNVRNESKYIVIRMTITQGIANRIFQKFKQG